MPAECATTARPRAIADLLDRARRLASSGQDAAAKQTLLQALHLDPTDAAALGGLAALALRSGHRAAARTAYEQAVRCHPRDPAMRVDLGNLLLEAGETEAARGHFAAALDAAPDPALALPEAHQGLARALTELGETEQAAPHWQRGFAGHARATRPYRGAGRAIPVLLLVAARGGNIPTRLLLDDRVFAVTALYADFADPAEPLPPHALVVNAIGDADLCGPALAAARAIVARSNAPVINHPDAVAPTGRAAIAGRLGALADVVTPAIRSLSRHDLRADPALAFPLLLRAPGFHTGRHFLRVGHRAGLDAALAALPGDDLLAIEYLDARGADGLARKYRVMAIDGALTPAAPGDLGRLESALLHRRDGRPPRPPGGGAAFPRRHGGRHRRPRRRRPDGDRRRARPRLCRHRFCAAPGWRGPAI